MTYEFSVNPNRDPHTINFELGRPSEAGAGDATAQRFLEEVWSTTNRTSNSNIDSSATRSRLEKLPQTATLEDGTVLYDIARNALMARSAITNEPTNKDAVLRECNRIMVLNGYEDARLDGKSGITTADLPKAWNGIRVGQEFKLYDDAALEKLSSVASQNSSEVPSAKQEAAGSTEPEPSQAKPEAAQGEIEQPAQPAGSGESDAEAGGWQEDWRRQGHPLNADPNSFFICQFRDARFNPNGPGSSMDCGPTSLAMIARYYDVNFNDPEKGAVDSGSDDPARLVSSVRFLMTGARDKDKGTGLGQIEKAAHDMGLNTQRIESVGELNDVLDSGKMVVLAGNPKDYQKDLGLRYGKGGTIYDGGHFITIVGRRGDEYIVNDPAAHRGSMILTRQQIDKYVGYVNPANMGSAVYP